MTLPERTTLKKPSFIRVKEWNKLSLEIHNFDSYSIFKNSLLKFRRMILKIAHLRLSTFML